MTLVACALFVVSCAVAYGGLFSHAYPGDAGTYAIYGRALVLHGQIPYRDFSDEYPPGSVGIFALPVLIWNAHYILMFKLLMTGCGVGFVTCAAWTLRRLGLSRWRLVPVVLAPVLLGPVFLNRYDPVPALLSALALVALLRTRERTAGALLGIGTAVKLFPVVLVLPAARYVRDRLGAGVAFVIAGAVLVLPFVALAPGGVGFSLKTQFDRHLQIESLGASILLVLSKLGIHHVGYVPRSSIDVGGSLASAVGAVSVVVAVVLVLLVVWQYVLGSDDDARLVTAFAACVTAVVAFGKVLSPQYLTWLVPLIPLAAGRKGRYAALAFLVSLALTQPEYIVDKWGLRHQNWTVWALLARNGALVVTFWFLVAQLREGVRRA
jgi:glycosyl transferase family 87